MEIKTTSEIKRRLREHILDARDLGRIEFREQFLEKKWVSIDSLKEEIMKHQHCKEMHLIEIDKSPPLREQMTCLDTILFTLSKNDREKRSIELSKEINEKLLKEYGDKKTIQKYFGFKKVEVELIKNNKGQ